MSKAKFWLWLLETKPQLSSLWLFRNFWLKTISLILAILTWLYVRGEITRMVLKF